MTPRRPSNSNPSIDLSGLAWRRRNLRLHGSFARKGKTGPKNSGEHRRRKPTKPPRKSRFPHLGSISRGFVDQQLPCYSRSRGSRHLETHSILQILLPCVLSDVIPSAIALMSPCPFKANGIRPLAIHMAEQILIMFYAPTSPPLYHQLDISGASFTRMVRTNNTQPTPNPKVKSSTMRAPILSDL